MTVIEPNTQLLLALPRPSFIVASDPALHFGDVTAAAPGKGAALAEIEDPELFRHLEEFIRDEAPHLVGEFSLAVHESKSLVSLGRFRMEVERSEQLEHALCFEKESFEGESPVFLDIARLANVLGRLLSELRRVLSAGRKPPHSERVQRARVKFLMRSYWDLLHTLCVHQAMTDRIRLIKPIDNVVEGLRERIAQTSDILRAVDPEGNAAKDIDLLFDFLTCGEPEEWEVLRELAPDALARVGVVVAKSTPPEGVVSESIGRSDEDFRRAADVQIREFIAAAKSPTPAFGRSRGNAASKPAESPPSLAPTGSDSAGDHEHQGRSKAGVDSGVADANSQVKEWFGLFVESSSLTIRVNGQQIKYPGKGIRRLRLLELMFQSRGRPIDHDTLLLSGNPFDDTDLITKPALRSMMRELKVTDLTAFPDLAKSIRGRTIDGEYRPYLDWPLRPKRS